MCTYVSWTWEHPDSLKTCHLLACIWIAAGKKLTQTVRGGDLLEVGAEEGERLVPDHLGESRVRQDDRPQALQAVAGHQGCLHGKLKDLQGDHSGCVKHSHWKQNKSCVLVHGPHTKTEIFFVSIGGLTQPEWSPCSLHCIWFISAS